MENEQRKIVRMRVQQELEWLKERSGIDAELITVDSQDFVIYRQLETSGGLKNLPTHVDVIVSVPNNYPTALLDMPALEIGCALTPYVVGGLNPQHVIKALNKDWRFLSFHPYSGQGSPAWNPNKHGFHDYYQHLVTWLKKI